MKSEIKKAIASVAVGAGLPRILARVFKADTLCILMYHAVVDVQPSIPHYCVVHSSQFRAQMAYLARHCRVLPLVDAVRRLKRDELEKGRATVAITFDDGLQNNHDVALPILQEFKLCATVFLTTGLVETDETVWTYRLHEALMATGKIEMTWRGEQFALRSAELRLAASARIRELLKGSRECDVRRETAEIVGTLGLERSTVEAASPFRMLDRASIGRCVDSGLINFGAHTQHHPILSHLTESAQRSEIAGSIEDVNRLTGQKCVTFAYPNGTKADFNDASVKILKDNEIEAAVTTRVGGNDPTCDTLQLNRYGVGAGTTQRHFQMLVHHQTGLGRFVA